jgi:GT2 family glycosyltransferase
VIVVDSGNPPVADVVKKFPKLVVDYKRWDQRPSAAGQRNGGVGMVRGDIDLVCFFDDDQTLYPDAIEKMISFWNAQGKSDNTGKPLGATSFFDDSWKDERPTRLKKSWLSQRLGLYTSVPGGVAPSGWQSLYYGEIRSQNLDVAWLSSQAIVVKRNLLNEYRFDEFFEGYSYLEDLDFSYSISRKYRLTVVADAKFMHYHSPAGRGSEFSFGRAEVRNRRYIVQKHGLSMPSFWMAMAVRMGMSFISGSFGRVAGNLVGILR